MTAGYFKSDDEPNAAAMREMAEWLRVGERWLEINHAPNDRDPWAIVAQPSIDSDSLIGCGPTIAEAWAKIKSSEGFPR